MGDFHTGVCIIGLPRDAVEDEHITIVYAGETDQLVSAPFSTMCEVVNRMASLFNPFPASVIGHDWFGPPDERVQVAKLDSPFLYTMRSCVEHFHNSQFGFRPHITAVNGVLRPVGSTVWFNRIAVWYGEDRMERVLGVGMPMFSMR